MKARYSSATLVLLGLWGCAHTHPEFRELDAKIIQVRKSQSEQKEYISQLEQSIAMRACGPVLKDMLNRIRNECHVRQVAEASAALPGHSAPVTPAVLPPEAVSSFGSCSTKQTGAAVVTATRATGKAIGETLQTVFNHAVVYIDEGQHSVPKPRWAELDALTTGNVLQTTRFLLISSPKLGEAEAERRIEVVRLYLLSHGAETWRFDPPKWVYDLNIPKQKLKGPERAENPEPDNPGRAVWVFRTDC